MKEVYYVTITSANEKGQKSQAKTTCKDLTEVGRCLITFKTKRGYRVTGVTCWLQMELDIFNG